MKSTLMHRRLARVMAMLPAHCPEIAQALALQPERMRRYMLWLQAEGLVSPGEYAQRAGRCWHEGTGRPFVRRTVRQMPDGIAVFGAVWRALASRQTVAGMAQRLGYAEGAVASAVWALHDHELARIAGWLVGNSRIATPVFDRLPGADAPYPYRERTEINAAHWARRREKMQALGLSVRDSVRELER